jgi:N-acetylglutamate synthase-like GNAT family acetyltransferase
MSGVFVRTATETDTTAVQALCRLLDPDDYVPDAWPTWLRMLDGINLVAEVDGRVVGCRHAELLTPHEAWSQAIRVHPAVQRRGIASQLIKVLEAELRHRGVHVVRGAIGASNVPSQALFEKAGFRTVLRVCRRRVEGRIGDAAGLRRAALPDAMALVRAAPVLASRAHLAIFRRGYFAMTDEHLVELVEHGAVVVSRDGQAYAILDLSAAQSSGTLWVVAMAGNPFRMRELLVDLVKEAGCSGLDVVVDSPAEPALQSALDAMGFKPPERYGEFVVVEHRL